MAVRNGSSCGGGGSLLVGNIGAFGNDASNLDSGFVDDDDVYMPWTAASKTVDESAGRIVWIQFFLCGHTSLCKPFYAFMDRLYTLEL